MKKRRLTVIIDRADYSDKREAKAVIQQVIAALKPFGGTVRIRVTRAASTIYEDKAWR